MARRNVAVLDHGMGNLRSVAKALVEAGGGVTVTRATDELRAAEALCVPGQGIFGRCMNNLRASSLDNLVVDWIGEGKQYLGICLGMQILFDRSDEGGGHEGLGLMRGEVRRLSGGVRVPHIGWNTVGDAYFYFDHSYAAYPADDEVVNAWCEHGGRWAASVRKGSILGVQFHPEKSGRRGIRLLEEWVAS